jgi:hypothetical protein
VTVKTGIFVIADITGYTAFLTQSELDHAHEILRTLFDTLLNNIKIPLQISNFQGDAIFSYIPEPSLTDGQTLLEMIENLYFEFLYTIEQMDHNTTCTCNACRNMKNLDLKIFVHYGAYIIQSMQGKEELSGPDVIIAHRMMKNQVKEKTGIHSYALITKAAAEQMRLDGLRAEMKLHREEYEHIGEINMLVHDLRPAWEREREKRRMFISPDEAWFSARYKEKWMDMLTVRRIDDKGGRTEIGSQFHCAHDVGNFYYTIIDWKPFEYYTTSEVADPLEIEYQLTYRVTPTKSGSRVHLHFGMPTKGDNLDEKRGIYQEANEEAMVMLEKFVESELATRNL